MSKITSKDKLINATIEVVYENGLYNVTTSKISKMASLSEAMIYKIFGSKDELVAESFIWIKGELYKYVDSKSNDQSGIDEQYYAVWLAHIDFFVENEKYLRFFSQFEKSKYMTEEVSQKSYVKVANVIELYEKGVKAGKFKSMDIEILNILFFAPILALSDLIVKGKVSKDKKTLKTTFESIMNALSV